jgi:hypothetical protein
MGVSPRIVASIASVLMAAGLSAPVHAAEAWPTAVTARYKLKFNGIDVGHITFTSKVTGQTYALTSDGEVSVLFGAVKWTGVSNVSGAVVNGQVAPKSYAFDWKKNKKGGAIRLGYVGAKAASVAVDPPPSTDADIVPITDAHKTGALDPLSAIMVLTRSDVADPCARRAPVYDGKHRFDIVFSQKRKALIPASKAGASSIGVVCRAMYEPIAGHKANADSKAYAANRDAEVTLRTVPGSQLLIPHSVNVPTAWGTGSMVMEKIVVTSPSAGQIALTD